MELNQLKTYKSAFNFIKNFILVLVPCVFFALCFFAYLLIARTNKGYESIWVLNPKTGAVVNTTQEVGESAQEREAEYHELVYQFINHWYAFDQFTYEKNTTMALNWIGNSGKDLLAAYKSKDIQRKLQENNMILTIEVDSIKFNTNVTPVTGVCYFTQMVNVSSVSNKSRQISATFFMVDTKERTIENSHKALIEGFTSKVVDAPISE